MSASGQSKRISEGEVIFGKVGLLVFLGVFLLGLGAERPLWTAAYRAFFVWLVFSLLGGSLRIGWKYHLYRKREQDLQRNLDHARTEEERLFRERRQRRDRTSEQAEPSLGASEPDSAANALKAALMEAEQQKRSE